MDQADTLGDQPVLCGKKNWITEHRSTVNSIEFGRFSTRTYVLHFLGNANPSKPGLTFKFGITSLHERHWIDIDVAFARIPDAAMIIPAILTRRDTLSD